MRRFSQHFRANEDIMYRKTLLLRRVPFVTHVGMKDYLYHYFTTHFPDHVITGIQRVYDCKNLELLLQRYQSAESTLNYCKMVNEKVADPDHHVKVRSSKFNCLLCCCSTCCCPEEDAEHFYITSKNKLRKNIHKEVTAVSLHHTGSFFISFQTEKMAIE